MHGWRRWLVVLLVGFCAGALADAWLAKRAARTKLQRQTVGRAGRSPAPQLGVGRPSGPSAQPAQPLGTAGRLDPRPPRAAADDLEALRARGLAEPIEGADVPRWAGSFAEARNGHSHEAVDILAPRGTAVHAADDGSIARLFVSRAGGNTIYQYDRSRRFAYYYAHLDRYADGLRDGAVIRRGEVIGYVGSSGNASPGAPHLHFAIFVLEDARRWWEGTPVDPYLVYRR